MGSPPAPQPSHPAFPGSTPAQAGPGTTAEGTQAPQGPQADATPYPTPELLLVGLLLPAPGRSKPHSVASSWKCSLVCCLTELTISPPVACSCRLPAQSCPGSAAHPLSLTHIEGVGGRPVSKLQIQEVGGLWVMAKPQGHTQYHTSGQLGREQGTGHTRLRDWPWRAWIPQRGGSPALALAGQHQGHGSQALGSQTLGSQALGSQNLGSQALGSQTLGSQTLGSQTQALGSQALGSGLPTASCLLCPLGFPDAPGRLWYGGLGAHPDPPTKHHRRLRDRLPDETQTPGYSQTLLSYRVCPNHCPEHTQAKNALTVHLERKFN